MKFLSSIFGGKKDDRALHDAFAKIRQIIEDEQFHPLAPNPAVWRIAIAQVPVLSADPRLAHKTTDRALYDRARAALPAGVDEYLFLNERGEAAEGTITTLFFDLGDGLRTPPLSSGCLPGCLRAELLATGRAREEPLPASLLPRAKLWMGNSLRGLIPAVLPAP